jgi:hypothetical protein
VIEHLLGDDAVILDPLGAARLGVAQGDDVLAAGAGLEVGQVFIHARVGRFGRIGCVRLVAEVATGGASEEERGKAYHHRHRAHVISLGFEVPVGRMELQRGGQRRSGASARRARGREGLHRTE